MLLTPHALRDFVPSRENSALALTMLDHATVHVVGHAHVERASRFARDDVDEVIVIPLHRCAPSAGHGVCGAMGPGHKAQDDSGGWGRLQMLSWELNLRFSEARMARIPDVGGYKNHRQLNKLDVTRAHIISCIQMIAIECDPISTHVLVMATEELILSIAKHKNIPLSWDYTIYVKDEHLKDYRAMVRRFYNFSKHADKDPTGEISHSDLAGR